MRLYYTGASPRNLSKARRSAPSHAHGMGWTPSKMTPHDVPYFVDNGGYTGDYDFAEWYDALGKALTEMPRHPDFIVLPDVFGDAKATIELTKEVMFSRDRRALRVRRGDLDRYVVFQPGASIDELFQFRADVAADGIFLGGPWRWKRAHGEEIVRRAHDAGIPVHLGNPGSKEGLVWAARVGFDSVDTTSIFQNQTFDWLEALEEADGFGEGGDGRQETLESWAV